MQTDSTNMLGQLAMQDLEWNYWDTAYWVNDLQGHKLLRHRLEKCFLGFFACQYSLGKPVQSRMRVSVHTGAATEHRFSHELSWHVLLRRGKWLVTQRVVKWLE